MGIPLEELIIQNEIDKEALDLMDCYERFVRLHEQFNSEILEIKKKHELPDGTLEALCGIADDQLELYREAWLALHDDINSDKLSFDVWLAFKRQWRKIRSDKA